MSYAECDVTLATSVQNDFSPLFQIRKVLLKFLKTTVKYKYYHIKFHGQYHLHILLHYILKLFYNAKNLFKKVIDIDRKE